MGCDIHIVAQKRDESGQWQTIYGNFAEKRDWRDSGPFDWRSYGMYAFLAGVRNYSEITPISEPRGYPEGFVSPFEYEEEIHSRSWLSVEELVNFDYDRELIDWRGYAPQGVVVTGFGVCMTYREFLGEDFFADLAELQRIGAERIVFGFDN